MSLGRGRLRLKNAREILSSLAGLKERVVAPWRSGDTPLELRKAIVQEVLSQLVAVGPGKKILPFNRVRAIIAPVDDEERWVLQEALPGWRRDLGEEISRRLREIGCEERPVEVELELRDDEEITEASPRYSVSLERSDEAPTPMQRPTIELEVQTGKAESESYHLTTDRIHIGRTADVLDEDGRIRRRNHIAFVDDDEVSGTVSREHARILYREDSPGYWLVDDRSAYGTRVFRNGRAIDVSSRDRRGILLQSGDDLYLGRAVLKCRIGKEKG